MRMSLSWPEGCSIADCSSRRRRLYGSSRARCCVALTRGRLVGCCCCKFPTGMRAEVVMQIERMAGWVGRMNGFELCDPLGWVAGCGARDCFLCLVERSTPFFGLDGHRQTGLQYSARTMRTMPPSPIQITLVGAAATQQRPWPELPD